MHKISRLICLGVALSFAGGIFSAHALPAGTPPPPPSVVAPPPSVPADIPSPPATTEALPPPAPAAAPSSPATTELPPLSEISDTNSEPAAKTASISHKAGRKKHKKISRRAGSSLDSHTRVRSAQISLTQLGYRPGATDGVMGTRTKSALKAFQRDHHLKADGILGPITYNALVQETGSPNPVRSSSSVTPPDNFFATHPDYYGYYGADYANPTSFGSPQMIPSRFGNLQLNAQQTGQTYQYEMELNGRPVFHADNQPSPINVSRTFNLKNSDAVVISTYAPGDRTCPYRHYVLVVGQNGNGVHQIENCTRDYQAFTEQGTLFVSFPGDSHNGWNAGTMWRYENGSLEKL